MHTRRILTAGLGLMLAFAALAPARAQGLSAREKREGFVSLFDGHDLKGWHSYLEKTPGSAWQVRHGAIELVKTPKTPARDYADLVTDQEFSNFDLRLEWKITCTNSGIMFYVHEDPRYANTYDSGPEMQVVDRSCSDDSHSYLHRAGDLYDLIDVDTETAHHGLVWNQVEIRSLNGHLQLYLNGHKVIDTHMWDAHWKALIAKSKFASIPGFGMYRKGHISFQGTEPNTRVWYRNIRIRRL